MRERYIKEPEAFEEVANSIESLYFALLPRPCDSKAGLTLFDFVSFLPLQIRQQFF
jgi:hypothetical protein